MALMTTYSSKGSMKVQLLSSILWNGQHQERGSVLEITYIEAMNLIDRGRAKPYAEPEKPAQNRAVALESSDEQTVTKRKYKKRVISGD